MSARRFTDEQEKEICRLYEADEKLSQVQLGKQFYVSSYAIGQILKRHQVAIKRTAHNRVFTEEQEQRFCKNYLENKNLTVNEVAASYGISNRCVRDILRRNGIEPRAYREQITKEQEKEICNEYSNDQELSVKELAQKHGIDSGTASRILKRNGCEIRREALSKEQEAEVCRRYQEETGSIELLATDYEITSNTLRSILKRNKIKLRGTRVVTPEQENEICSRYVNDRKLTVRQLSDEFKVAAITLTKILNRNGIKQRSKAEVVKHFTDEEEKDVCRRYLEDKALSAKALAKQLNTSQGIVQHVLKRNGVKLRTAGEIKFKFSKEEELKICQHYESNKSFTLAELGRQYNVCSTTIGHIIDRNGIKRHKEIKRSTLITEDKKREFIKLAEEGVKTSDIAKSFGVNFGTVHRVLKENNVMNCHVGGPCSDKAKFINHQLAELVQSLGNHIEHLPQKSWLAILRQSKALKNIGPHSKLAPVKIALLKGEIKPEDILPPAPDPDAPADAPAPKSKLQEALDNITAAHNDDDFDEPDDSQPAQVEDDPIDIVDETEERQQRLANIRPAERLSIATAASKATSDEKVLRGICHAQCEALWTQVFNADVVDPAAAIKLVDEVKEAVPTDEWSKLVRDSFLDDWQLVQDCKQIPGLLMPDGWRLNLMQRREAALLRRDRARLNISGMGAGKTLSAIAGMQVMGSNRVLVLCPNATIKSAWLKDLKNHLPLASKTTQTWNPDFLGSPLPHWVINNHEMLSDLKSTEVAAFLHVFEPDAVIIDEVHLCKARTGATESQRHRNLQALTDWCRDNDAAVYGMSGTPVVNELSEPISLLRLVRPDLAKGLDSKLTGDNCMAIHEALQPISSRFVPPPAAIVEKNTIEVRADNLLEDALEASKSNGVATDAAIAPAKFNAVLDLAKQDGKLLVFTSSVAGVVDALKSKLTKAGIKTVVHTGSEKGKDDTGNVKQFIENPDVQVLIASTSTLATGFDGLQAVCNRIVFLTLPWTAAEHEQAVARILRQGVQFKTVEVHTICASLVDPTTGEDWSLDHQKLERLDSKRSISAAVCDGIIPDESALRGGLTVVAKAHRTWAKKVRERLAGQP